MSLKTLTDTFDSHNNDKAGITHRFFKSFHKLLNGIKQFYLEFKIIFKSWLTPSVCIPEGWSGVLLKRLTGGESLVSPPD